MLRHAVLVSLAVTVCASLIPTKVNAATLSIFPTLHPGGEIALRPGDIIDFKFSARGEQNSLSVVYNNLRANFDSSELEEVTPLRWLVSRGISLQPTYREIATWRLKVKTPLRDLRPDVWATLFYDEETQFGPTPGRSIDAIGADVVPVPEPLTMLGAAAALGYGAILKRKYAKNIES